MRPRLAGGAVVVVGGLARVRLPSAAAAVCSVSEAALAASAAAVWFPVAVQNLIRAVASAAVRAAYSHRASASSRCQRGVRPGRAGRPLSELRPGQVGGELAASVPDRFPFVAVSSGNVTAYPVSWRDFLVLYRRRTRIPAWSSRAKNSSALAADAAAVVTWRRGVGAGRLVAFVGG